MFGTLLKKIFLEIYFENSVEDYLITVFCNYLSMQQLFMCLFLGKKCHLKFKLILNIFASFRLGVYLALKIRILMSSFVLFVIFVFA